MENVILYAHRGDKLTPELCAALQEVAQLAIKLEGQLPVLKEPPHEKGSTEQHPCDHGANDSERTH
jgi:hypothetical protein